MRSLQSQACVQLPRFSRISHHWLWGGIRQIDPNRINMIKHQGISEFCLQIAPILHNLHQQPAPLAPMVGHTKSFRLTGSDRFDRSDRFQASGAHLTDLTAGHMTSTGSTGSSPQQPAAPGRWFWWRPPLSHGVWKRIAGAAWNPRRNAGQPAVPTGHFHDNAGDLVHFGPQT